MTFRYLKKHYPKFYLIVKRCQNKHVWSYHGFDRAYEYEIAGNSLYKVTEKSLPLEYGNYKEFCMRWAISYPDIPLLVLHENENDFNIERYIDDDPEFLGKYDFRKMKEAFNEDF